MANKFETPALRELRAVFNEADQLSAKPELSKRDEARINVLLAKIAALRQNIAVPDEAGRVWLRDFFKGREVEQRANLVAGGFGFTYTQGAPGGYSVPQEFADALIFGAAQFDPLLDEKVVTLIKSKDFSLRPYPVPGWDLSTIAATKVAETTQQVTGTVPPAASAQLGSYTYRISLGASFEFEDDDFQTTLDQIIAAYAVAFGRGIGSDLVNGNGTTAPQGITNAPNGATNATTAVLTDADVDAYYFGVDAAYRAQPKCAWLMNDATYQIVRKAKDAQSRPLLDIIHEPQLLMGKPVYITPSLPSFGGTGNKSIIFGDLSHFVVRVSQPLIARNLQAAGYVEAGLGLYTGILRADAKILDPTNGTKPPIVVGLMK